MNTTEEQTKPEYSSFKDLIEVETTKLRQVLSKANKSPLYRDHWKAVGFHPDQVQCLEDLQLLPYITRKELFEATRTKRSKVACSPIKAWFAGSSPTTPYEWFPFSAKDFFEFAPMLARMSHAIGLKTGDIVLTVVDSYPRVSAVIPILWSFSKDSGVPRLEFITGSLDWYDTLNFTWIDFIQRRRPTVLFTSTKNALTLADKIQKDLKVQVKKILTETRIGIFHGEPLGENKAKILEAYSLTPYEVYSPTEHMSFCTECNTHQGIHIWMDKCIPEIIPTECEDAVPIWKTPQGTTGELVITNFADCLPLLHYKTGELIRIESTDICPCGRVHPRISRLQREPNDLLI